MGELLDFMNANAGSLQVLFAAIVSVATVVYAILTWQLVKETQQMRRAQSAAKVSIGIEPRPEYLNWIDVFIRNGGPGPAYDVRFEVGSITDGHGDLVEEVRSLGPVKNGMSYLAPGQEIRSFFTNLVDGNPAKLRTKVPVRIIYRSAGGQEHSDDYLLDFSVFEGLHQLGEPDMHRIAKALTAIQKDLGHCATGFKKLHVLTQDKNEYKREREEYFDSLRAADDEPAADR